MVRSAEISSHIASFLFSATFCTLTEFRSRKKKDLENENAQISIEKAEFRTSEEIKRNELRKRMKFEEDNAHVFVKKVELCTSTKKIYENARISIKTVNLGSRT